MDSFDFEPLTIATLPQERGVAELLDLDAEFSVDEPTFVVKPPNKLYRGVMSSGKGAGTYSLGKGLYSTPNKKFLKNFDYDNIIELDPKEHFPRNPLVLRTADMMPDWLLKESGHKSMVDFNKAHDLTDFIKSRGHDGVVAGDEVVKYLLGDDQDRLSTEKVVESSHGDFDSEPAPSSPQESFIKEDPDTGMSLHGFTGKVLDPKTNTLKHYVQGKQVHSDEYEDSLLTDPDISPTTEEGWSHEGVPLTLGEDATHTKGEAVEDETPEESIEHREPPTETQKPEVDPLKGSYDATEQARTLHGEDNGKEEVAVPVGDSQHVLGAEGIEDADPQGDATRQESLKFVQKTAQTTLGKFPEGAKASLKKNAPNVSFFSTPAKLTEELAKLSPEVADNVAKGIVYHGAYLPGSKRLLLDGGNEKGTTEDIHAYEMSRAMADGREDSPEWKAAVAKDFKDESLTVYASDPRRAWGEFGRLAIGKQVSADALRQKYPTAVVVWESYGLLPKTGKGEMVQLPEIFKPDVALFDDPTAEADSAYSLKETGIATYARMGRQSLSWLKDNSELVGDWAKSILSKTPPGLRMAVTGAMKKIYFTYYLANNVTREMMKARGVPEDKAKWLASTLTGADFLFGSSKILPIVTAAGATAAGANPLVATGAAIAANFLPVGSLAYIALASGGKHSAIDTWKRASKKVKAIVSKHKEGGAEFAEFEKEDLLELITSHILASKATDHHLWLACFLSAMDETEGNVRVSCEIADEAAGDDDGDSEFEDAGPNDPTKHRDKGYEPKHGDPTPIKASDRSKEAAGHSEKAWDATIHALKRSDYRGTSKTLGNGTLLAQATRASKHAREGNHKSAAMDHSLLFRAHRERKHPEAEQAHWNAMLSNEKIGNNKDFEHSSKEFSRNVLDLDKEFSVADFTKSKVQVVVDALKSDFKEPDKGKKLKSTIKEGLEEGSQEVVKRFYKGEVPKEVESLRKKFIEDQLTYLAKYVDGVYKGVVAVDPTRSAMYASSLKTFSAEILKFQAQRKGAKWERRLLGKGDHSCPACVKLWHKRWVKFGTLPKIGDTTCKVNCNCRFQYSYDKKKPS